MIDDFVKEAMSSAGITELDKRGLMPLAAARKHLASVSAFGPYRTNAEKHDKTWAALVSLADGKEFVREARRLSWKGSPRGMDNVAPFQRYGAAILPWLLDALDAKKKTFRNQPWCIAPCLVLIGGKQACEVVLDAEKLDTESYVHESIDALFEALLDAHPAEAWPALAKRALAGDARATASFKRLVKGRSRGALDAIGSALGKDARAKIERQFGVTAKLEAGEILGLMDASFSKDEWPIWNHDFEETMEYLALRLVAARGDGDRWGVCLECLIGCSMDYFSIQRFVFGSEVTPGRLGEERAPDVDVTGPAEYDGEAVGTTIRGPKGKLTLKKEDIKALDSEARQRNRARLGRRAARAHARLPREIPPHDLSAGRRDARDPQAAEEAEAPRRHRNLPAHGRHPEQVEDLQVARRRDRLRRREEVRARQGQHRLAQTSRALTCLSRCLRRLRTASTKPCRGPRSRRSSSGARTARTTRLRCSRA